MSFARPKPKKKKKKKKRRKKRFKLVGGRKQKKEGGEVGNSNISVYVRVRPLLKKEVLEDQASIVNVIENKVVSLSQVDSIQNVFGTNIKGKKRRFEYDCVFDRKQNQIDVFDGTVKNDIGRLIDGYSCSMFCYGQTGAGKTYSMVGTKDHPGLMYLCVDELFSVISSEHKKEKKFEFEIKLSYFEIYNENIRDLLTADFEGYLSLRETKKGAIIVVGLSEHRVSDLSEVMTLILRGNDERTSEPNSYHEHSSRSHAILQIKVVKREKLNFSTYIQNGIEMENVPSRKSYVSVCHLVDLAGSERSSNKNQRNVNVRNLRFYEGVNINKSLLALATCINVLSKKKGKKHIPYRNSKLTRILKDSLSGNSKTTMLATINPSNLCFSETTNTLMYASRAKLIKTTNTKNIEKQDTKLYYLTKLVHNLKNEVKELKAKLTRDQVVLGKTPSINNLTFDEKEKRSDVADSGETEDVTEKGSIEEEYVGKVKEKLENEDSLSEEIVIDEKSREDKKEIPKKKGDTSKVAELKKKVIDNYNKKTNKAKEVIDIEILEMKSKVLSGKMESKIHYLTKMNGRKAEINFFTNKKNKIDRDLKNLLNQKKLKTETLGMLVSEGKVVLAKLSEVVDMSSHDYYGLLERNFFLESENYKLKYESRVQDEVELKTVELEKLKFQQRMMKEEIEELKKVKESSMPRISTAGLVIKKKRREKMIENVKLPSVFEKTLRSSLNGKKKTKKRSLKKNSKQLQSKFDNIAKILQEQQKRGGSSYRRYISSNEQRRRLEKHRERKKKYKRKRKRSIGEKRFFEQKKMSKKEIEIPKLSMSRIKEFSRRKKRSNIFFKEFTPPANQKVDKKNLLAMIKRKYMNFDLVKRTYHSKSEV